MLYEIALVSAGVAAGVAFAGGMAHRLYAWQRAELDAPDAATWRRGYEAGKSAARGINAEVERRHEAWFRAKDALESGRMTIGVDLARPGADRTAETLLAPGEAPVHRSWIA